MIIEETVRQYDGKIVVWEKKFLPELVPHYERIKSKEYCSSYFWVITEVRDGKS
jgi:hypothetical protein|tara:strand:+ start:467 stop:628 length:162 start_codon:yes stop_codon:yes gene_type:complete